MLLCVHIPYFKFTHKQLIIIIIVVFALKLHLCVIVYLRYILDLNKEQEADFAKKVASIALGAEFEPWLEGKSDDIHAVFIPQKK